MNDPKVARAWVWEVFKGTCQGCGKTTWSYGESWECDHREPLFLANNDLSYWAKENLQILCFQCHQEKTKTDMKLFREIADLNNFKKL